MHHKNEIRPEKIITDFSYSELQESDYPQKDPEYDHVWYSACTDIPIGIAPKINKKTECPNPTKEQYELIESEKDNEA